ncbi:cytochrome c oxidase subunit 2 [Paenibacillus rhizosphaerae]|uniref:Cytochrome c oxidase subunit 2 n=1 Tax=Paenibacillus rhizosphaerae TaxID=297318 RepID=A0A839TL05_9BACL|nr:cupredoxin domain-containing protein [Paenibacillus rhizosphaerae]MBB3125517.1 cytochrome c oxidase subunit 2 [Paenibacillus rhizosphaerae]
MHRITWVSVMIVAHVILLTACGASNNEKAESAPSEQSTTIADEVVIKAANWKFDKAEYRIKKGEAVKLTLESESGVHSIAFKGLGIKELRSGDSEVVTINEAGTYELFCNTMCGSGHANMKAKLIVE